MRKLGVTGAVGQPADELDDWSYDQVLSGSFAARRRELDRRGGTRRTSPCFSRHGSRVRRSRERKLQALGITYINNVKTPLMLIAGEADWRTPTYAGGEEMFRALKYKKIPTVMVRFPNETHELSRSGQPWHRIERLQHIVGWFDKWLMGIPKPEYDIGMPDTVTTSSRQ
jgi:dipeptidyl aminopeptidase/acylaminoacyl peptidase